MAYDNESVQYNSSVYDLTIGTQPPQIEINAGNGTFDYGTLTQNHTINFTITSDLLDQCWYEYNGTNSSDLGCSSEVLESINFTLEKDVYNATIYANDTAGNIESEVVEWDYKVFENSQTYETEVYETQRTNIILNITYDPLEPITAILNYGGINYTSTNLGSGSSGSFSSREFNVPLVEEETNKTFYWILDIGEQTILTENKTQVVKPLNLTLCNGESIKALNFTFYDELSQEIINAGTSETTIKANFKYWLGNGGIYKEYNFQNISSSLNNYGICTNTNETIKIDMDMEYSAESYSDRTFYFREEEISNETKDIYLYVLSSPQSIGFEVEIRQGINSLNGGLVEVWKDFVGTGEYEKIMVGLTDDNGVFSAPLDLNKNYIFRIYQDNYNVGNYSKSSICSSAPCEININVEEVNITAYEEYYKYFAENIDYNLTYNTTSKIITLTFEDLLGTATYWRLFVYKTDLLSGEVMTICDKKLYSSNGEMTCNYSGEIGSNIFAKVYVSRSPEKLVEYINIIQDMTSTIGVTSILASVFIILVFVFAGIMNPTNVFILLPSILVLLKLIGLMPLGWLWISGFTAFCFWIIARLNT